MLRWSINLFRVFGIQLAMHVSFLLLLVFAAWEGVMGSEPGEEGLAVLWSVAFVLMIFICVVLHELGHSLVAKRHGVNVPRILLLPIGGMAEFDRIPRQPAAELRIAIAGPAVNFVLAALCFPLRSHPVDFGAMGVPLAWSEVPDQLLYANLIMGCFNLIPVFPMDGGRIFRALLATRLAYLRATYWAASVGKSLAVVGAAVMAFYYHHYLGAIMFGFIFMAADGEYRQVLRREEEARFWAEAARRIHEAAPPGTAHPWDDSAPPPLHGPN